MNWGVFFLALLMVAVGFLFMLGPLVLLIWLEEKIGVGRSVFLACVLASLIFAAVVGLIA